MGKSKVTIKEIADKAGVSIATVSHVINRTRYVRPELVDKIEKIIVETGYQNKIADKERKLLVGRESTIVAVIPNIESTIYRDMVAYVEQLVSVQGYQFLVAITDNDFKEETQVLAGLLVNKKVAGIIHAPVSDVATNYTKLIQSGVPFVCVERNILGSGIDSVEFRDREAIFKGADYLLASGHKNVLFFRESTDSTTRDERTKGFLSALQKYNINTNDANIVDVTLENGEAALDASMSLAEDIITANTDLQAFFCINDPSALGAAAAVKAANKTGQIGVYSIDASPDGKQALLDGEFTAVACQVPVQIAEYAFNAAQKYVGGDTTIDEKKVYLDSHLVLKDEAEKTVNDWQ